MLPTSTDVKVEVAVRPSKRTGAVALFLAGEKELAGVEVLSPELRDAADSLVAAGGVRAKPGDVGTTALDGTRVLVVAIGENPDADKVRHASATVARQAKKYALKEVTLVVPLGESALAQAAATGFLLGAFEYREYRGAAGKQREAEALGKLKLTLVTEHKEAALRGEAIALGQNYARTIASRPGNDINPPSLAREAVRLGKETGLGVKIIDEKGLARLGTDGLLAVGRGSGSPPRLIAIEYGLGGGKGKGGKQAKGSKPPLLVVGKAITFDTGGISIKPAADMGSMIYDKCGGMAVLGLMAAIAKLKPDRPVVGLLAAAENMPGPNAYRPGDILRMYNGVTVEVTNTDAEGRLVLADALAWGIETYKPAACVDLATLTGAAVVALGLTRAGAWCNNEPLWQALSTAAGKAGEKMWRMPLGDDYRELLKASAADIVNSPGRWGGACTAAEFLHHFIPGNLNGGDEPPWCHLDIAPTADTDKETPLYTKGATGYGVRLLVEWVTGA